MNTALAPSRILPTLVDLISLTKPRVTSLVMATVAVGMGLAPVVMGGRDVALMLGATLLVVASANVANCWLERETDGLMPRTRTRALPAGRLDPTVALAFAAVLALVAIPALTFLINPITGLLGALALFSYVAVYTPMKTHSSVALFVGAVPGALPPLMGWTAATGTLSIEGLVLFGIVFLWQLPHVIGLASYRRGEYAAAGIKVLPVVRTLTVVKWHAVLWTSVLLLVSLSLVPLGVGGRIYGASALVLGVLYIGSTLRGFRDEPGGQWGRRVFMTSLLYLPLLFTALLLDN